MDYLIRITIQIYFELQAVPAEAMAAISTENQDAVNLAGLQQTGLLYL